MVYEQRHAIRKTLDIATRYVNKEKYEELKRFAILPGDIIVSCRGTIGEIFLIPDNAPLGIMHPSIMKIRLKDKVYNKVFFLFLLERCMAKHAGEAKGTGVKMAVTATTLGKEEMPIPPMELQKQFANVVSKVEASKATIRQSLSILDTLKKSLMQQYFG